ncbi:MAG: alpha/beta hydrolase [Winogradskyella sp.]|nr:alpha/beta hydrolase [Winogradskyella sp.]
MKFKYIFAFFFSWIFFGCNNQKYNPVKYPKNYIAQIDTIYHAVDSWEGRIDLYTNPTSDKPTPIVLNIHGGGWHHGVKESQTSFGSFFNNGFAVANVEYRLVDVAPAPAAIEDVRCALIYLLNNAKALNIDTTKIVIMGTSAGGHLALMAGLLGNNSIFDRSCSYEGDVKVVAIINKYGITDFNPIAKMESKKRWLDDRYNDQEFIKSVSPINYVSKNSPPVFIAHGNLDTIVPYSQSVKLYNTLQKFGVTTKFLTIPNAGHGKLTKEEEDLFRNNMWFFLNKII